MEEIKDNMHISFIGSRESVGNSFVSLNFVMEMISRNFNVIYSGCEEDSETRQFFKYISPAKEKDSVSLNKTRVSRLQLLSFSKTFDSRYSVKVESLMRELEAGSNVFIHNIRNSLANPYNLLLQNSDIWVITLRIEATAVSDYFNLVKKMLMLEKHPAKIHIVFNYTRDIERAFETYQKILKDTIELSIDIRPVFLGIVQNDLLRQAHAMKLGQPIRQAFSECSVSGSISFMADKILRKRSDADPSKDSLLLEADDCDSDDEI